MVESEKLELLDYYVKVAEEALATFRTAETVEQRTSALTDLYSSLRTIRVKLTQWRGGE